MLLNFHQMIDLDTKNPLNFGESLETSNESLDFHQLIGMWFEDWHMPTTDSLEYANGFQWIIEEFEQVFNGMLLNFHWIVDLDRIIH